eukprot:5816500-Prymnesium_polylepis.1
MQLSFPEEQKGSFVTVGQVRRSSPHTRRAGICFVDMLPCWDKARAPQRLLGKLWELVENFRK